MSSIASETSTISEKDRKALKRGVYAFGFIVIFGSISYVLTTYWDTLPAPPRSHKIVLDGTPSNDPEHISAVLLQAEPNQVQSKEKLAIHHMTFYASEADANELHRFYREALSTPWYVAADQESKGQHTMIYREMFQSEMKIIIIKKRFMSGPDRQIEESSGSIVGTADLLGQ